MKKTLLLASSALFALTVCGAASAAGLSASSHVKATGVIHPHAGAKMLYNQNSNSTGVGLVSDNFTSGSFSTYDDNGADDFVVPTGKKWKVGEVDVTGVYFNGSGPSAGENITFYKDASGVPGKTVKHGTFTGVACTDSAGSFSCKLPKKVKLKAGHYWVSVQADMNFVGGKGEWGWEGNSVINNDPAQWENPGGGFGTSCSSWGSNSTCLGYNQDDMFDLQS